MSSFGEIGDNPYNPGNGIAYLDRRLDFTCQVGDTRLTPVVRQLPDTGPNELTGFKDVHCQVSGLTNDVEIQAKRSTRSVHSQSRRRLADAHSQSAISAAYLDMLRASQKVDTQHDGHTGAHSESRPHPDISTGQVGTREGESQPHRRSGTDVECQSDFEEPSSSRSSTSTQDDSSNTTSGLYESTRNTSLTQSDISGRRSSSQKRKEVRNSASQCDMRAPARVSSVASQTRQDEVMCHVQTQADAGLSDVQCQADDEVD